jgi:hypothetical protein
MNIIGVGSWEFELPEDWELQEARSGVPYMQASDGTKGCYIKGITFGQVRATGADAAAYLQEAHERGFTGGPESKWAVAARSLSSQGQDALSVLDLFDVRSNYRVLSVVLAAPGEALQVTLHDYDCRDYDASCLAFAHIVKSVRRARPDA